VSELVAGARQQSGVERVLAAGTLRRPLAVFRNWFSGDVGPFRPEARRYQLMCRSPVPRAHRTIIMRGLKDHQSLIGLLVVHWLMGDDGWSVDRGPGPDSINSVEVRRDLFTLADSKCTSRVTAPVLWDEASRQVVSIESSEVLRAWGVAH
jgi:glutathionyl-hydroquinone reductase